MQIARKYSGGISAMPNFITGQFTPQKIVSSASSARSRRESRTMEARQATTRVDLEWRA